MPRTPLESDAEDSVEADPADGVQADPADPGSRIPEPEMIPIQNFAGGVVAEIIRRQPASKEKTAFAWQLAVGPALARVTTVELSEHVLTVRAADTRWIRELRRASDTILARMQHLLGRESIVRMALIE